MNKIRLMKKNIKYFVPLLLKNNPFSVIILILNAILGSISSLVWVVFPALIVSELEGTRNEETLIMLVLIFSISLLISRTLSTMLSQINDYCVAKTDLYIDQMFNEKIARIDYFNIEDATFNDELSYAKKCLSEYSGGIYSITYYLEVMLRNILTLISTIGVLLFSPIPKLIVIIIVGIIIICTYLSSIIEKKNIKIEDKYNKLDVRLSRVHWYFNNSIMRFKNQKVLRSYSGKKLINKYGAKTCDDINKINQNKVKELNKVSKFSISTKYLIRTLVPLLLLIFTSFKYGIEIAIFTLVFQTINTINENLSTMLWSFKHYEQDVVYQDNFINIMNKESIFKDGNIPLSSLESIEFKNVSFKYPNTEAYVLKNISFKIENKQKVSLVGLNGAGKTTIIKLLCRFYEVVEGEILVNDVNIKNYKYEDYMKQLSVVFQDFKIISFSVKDNIVIIDENKEKLDEVLKRAGIYEKIQSLPNKEYTFINKWFDRSGVEFSGGEMQKLALARALYKDSDLVILDEPTSALDPIAEAQIYYHFNEVVGKKLCLFISHRLSSCIFSDRIMVIDGSCLVEVGTHDELMSNENGLYYKMFNAQAEYYK